MGLIALHLYYMPYQKLYINILESVILADLVVLLMVASTEQFKAIVVLAASYINAIAQ